MIDGANWLNFWPALQRELREGARRPTNHRLRVSAATGGTLLLWFTAVKINLPSAQLGAWLFAGTHTFVLLCIALIVPALAADSLAREKREGTLGLLFLTPLTAGGIVLAKSLAVILRTLTVWLAALPLLTIPFLTGGVAWFDVGSAISIEFSVIMLCLGVGLFASAVSRERNVALVLVYILTAASILLLGNIMFGYVLIAYQGWKALSENSGQFVFLAPLGLTGLWDLSDWVGWSAFASRSSVITKAWTEVCCLSPLACTMFFAAMAFFATRVLARAWGDAPPSARRQKLERVYCAPLLQRRFRRRMSDLRNANPVSWLQRHSWKAGVWMWSLCLFSVLMEGLNPRDAFNDRPIIDQIVVAVLALIYTFVGVNSFLEEKRSGALELLLVTPLPVAKIIWGRVTGLWLQFLPAALIVGGCFLADDWFHRSIFVRHGSHVMAATLEGFWIPLAIFLTLPIFATYFALRVRNLFAAAALTWLALAGASALTASLRLSLTWHFAEPDLTFLLPTSLFSFGLFALVACFLLRHSLARRIYSF